MYARPIGAALRPDAADLLDRVIVSELEQLFQLQPGA
jgi:hypothetical protein